jgi:hypothetical protein
MSGDPNGGVRRGPRCHEKGRFGRSKPHVKRFISGVMRKTQWRKLALPLMDS